MDRAAVFSEHFACRTLTDKRKNALTNLSPKYFHFSLRIIASFLQLFLSSLKVKLCKVNFWDAKYNYSTSFFQGKSCAIFQMILYGKWMQFLCKERKKERREKERERRFFWLENKEATGGSEYVKKLVPNVIFSSFERGNCEKKRRTPAFHNRCHDAIMYFYKTSCSHPYLDRENKNIKFHCDVSKK